tara:strand:+ start:506 stop:868 length:363 start_codon:yes stop_codon:yes gene_type:complete
MSKEVKTVNQSIVNTATTEKKVGDNDEIVTKKVYSKERFQIKNSGDLIDRPLPAELSPEQVKSIASTRDKLQYKKNATYKLVNSYLVDYKRDEQGKKIPLATEDHFRVGIYAVPKAHTLV